MFKSIVIIMAMICCITYSFPASSTPLQVRGIPKSSVHAITLQLSCSDYPPVCPEGSLGPICKDGLWIC